MRDKPAQKGLSSTDPAFRTPFKNFLVPGAPNTLDRLFGEGTSHPSHCTRTVGKSKTKAGGKNFVANFQQQIKWGLKERDELLKSVPIKWKAKTNWQYSAGFMSHCENGSPYTVGTYITYYNTLCPCFKSSLLLTTKHAGVAYSLWKWVKADVSGKRKFIIKICGVLVGEFFKYF